jgi:hypothetical protein
MIGSTFNFMSKEKKMEKGICVKLRRNITVAQTRDGDIANNQLLRKGGTV